MIIQLAHKIALDPNNAQETFFRRAAGTARFAYNWALAEWQRQYEAGEKPSETALRRQLNAIKRERYPWMYEVPKTAPQQAIKDLGAAFQRFFKRLGAYPTFKKRGRHDSFRADDGPFDKHSSAVKLEGRKMWIPKLGWVRMRERPRFSGRIISATISRTADRWYVSLQIETEDITVPVKSHDVVGVDLGIRTLATLSTGEKFEGPKALRGELRRLRRLSRELSRRTKGSKNWRKTKRKIARLHARIANIRRDALHKLTSRLTRTARVIGVEDLDVRGMLQNRRLARLVADCGFHEFRRQLAYKCRWYETDLVVADRWYPSSKRCSVCGYQLEVLPLCATVWVCPHCEARHDRDINASINLARQASTAVSTTVAACGGEGSGAGSAGVKPAPVKQEAGGSRAAA